MSHHKFEKDQKKFIKEQELSLERVKKLENQVYSMASSLEKIAKFINVSPTLKKFGFLFIFNGLLLMVGQTFQFTKAYWIPIDLFIMCTSVTGGFYLITQFDKIKTITQNRN